MGKDFFVEFDDGGFSLDVSEYDVRALDGTVRKEFDPFDKKTLIRRVDKTVWKIVGNKIVRLRGSVPED